MTRGNLILAAFLPCALIFDYLFFRYVLDGNYFTWYLANGWYASFFVTSVGLVWKGLPARLDLLSANPVLYTSGAFKVVGSFLIGAGEAVFEATHGRSGSPFARVFGGVEWLLAMVVVLLLAAASLAWLVVISPVVYLITLGTGVIARQHLRSTGPLWIARNVEQELVVEKWPRGEKLPAGATDISLANDAFGITQAINTMALFAGKLIYAQVS